MWARVDSGGVEASGIAGPVDAQTDSGGVRISQTKPASIRARTDSGGVQVKLVSGAGYDIHAEGAAQPGHGLTQHAESDNAKA